MFSAKNNTFLKILQKKLKIKKFKSILINLSVFFIKCIMLTLTVSFGKKRKPFMFVTKLVMMEGGSSELTHYKEH
tara:strand:- start:135 stop:359 length:225 start_codon:yes stop_codon:yes gene_type:complete